MSEIQDATGSAESPAGARAITAPVIVVGLDGSPPSWDAFAWAAGEAHRCHGSLIAVYATPAVDGVVAMGAPVGFAAVEQSMQEIAEQLKDEATQRADDLGVHLSFLRVVGDPTFALTNSARSAHADLIVVGRSTKMLHQLAGSLGRRLVSRRDAPAIVVVP
jgi:nucleotide-binding universal stress UspA family protein